MGGKLSCMSKQKNRNEEDIGKPRKPKGKLGKKKVVVTVEEETQPKQAAAPPVAQTVETAVNHVQTEAETAVRKRARLVVLKPAAASAHVPAPSTQNPSKSGSVSPPLNKTTYVPLSEANRSKAADIHTPQPVDQAAREIALADAKPASWKDLYWALIGQRNLKSDEEKVKAIFSWLCSIPLDQDAFLTKEDLERAAKENVQYAKECLAQKSDSVSPDSPEVVINDLSRGKSTYLRAFESLCRYSGIPCCTVKGLAKGVDYTVGMTLTDQSTLGTENSPINKLQHAWSAAYIDGKWALFDSMWAAERLAMSANARLSQIAQVGQMEYETDMFYFNASPAQFIYSHFPFDDEWQLLAPPMSLKQFQDSVLLKPAFFTYGLGLFSHQEGVIPVQDKLILKIAIPKSHVNDLLFTFNLKTEERKFEDINLSRFGMHEISRTDCSVTFSFRFPKPGAYKLTIYARKVGDPLFTDVCEYRVQVKPPADKEKEIEKDPGHILLPPFPPTSQSHYGPTEKAEELKIRTVEPDLTAQQKCVNGVFEIRFMTTEPNMKLPKMTARLKSLLEETSTLVDCLLVRNTEATLPATVTSQRSLTDVMVGSPVQMVVITAFLPAAGEYALEVYAAPAEADENTSYFLVWQFLIDSEVGVKLSTPVRKRLATANFGPQDDSWTKLGLKTITHPDPFIQVPTVGSTSIQKARSKSELIQQFVNQSEKQEKTETLEPSPKPAEDSTKQTGTEETPGPRSCDLKIVIEKPVNHQLCLVGQLVDISEPQEEDRTTYLLQHPDKDENESVATGSRNERVNFLIRIPKGGHFYKFYLYATMVEDNPAVSLPLVYTYLIEAPKRLMAEELPYIGAKYGAFPEKLEQREKQTNK
ncbi:unnamed protein product [Calicophoron daubneyi]|uniref:Kyphoscoliosis peptidase n=1 Tax=Calicophoron daubneyi TaxID=300641 RepID=A0AAV2TK65_CALDB